MNDKALTTNQTWLKRAQAFKEADNIITAHTYNKHLLCIGLNANIVIFIFTPLP